MWSKNEPLLHEPAYGRPDATEAALSPLGKLKDLVELWPRVSRSKLMDRAGREHNIGSRGPCSIGRLRRTAPTTAKYETELPRVLGFPFCLVDSII